MQSNFLHQLRRKPLHTGGDAMNYLTLLADDEVRYICDIILYKEIIGYFKRNPKEFNKICKGFRATSLSEDRAIQLLMVNANSNHFISSFLENHIDMWLSQIKSHYDGRIKSGDTQTAALLNTLPFSVFSDNISIYLKLTSLDLSGDVIDMLREAVLIIKTADTERQKLEHESNNKDSSIKQLQSESRKLSSDLEKAKGKIKNSIDESNILKRKIVELEKSAGVAAQDQALITSLQTELQSCRETIRKLRVDMSTATKARQELESQIREEIEKQQADQELASTTAATAKCPSDLDELRDYLNYNLKNIGVDASAEYFPLLLKFLSKVLFQGTPILINRVTGINLMTCLSNALLGHQNIKTLQYDAGISQDDIKNFLSSCERIAHLDNFIGNYNETELLPLLEGYQNKIVFLTVAYDRTLFYISQEFLKYCQYINLNRIGALSVKVNLTEDPSILTEVDCDPRGAFPESRYSLLLREILCELDFNKGFSEQVCSSILDEQDLIQILAFIVLPYCADVMKNSPFNMSERLLKYAGERGRCPNRDLLRRWFAS
jgi:hypothetical protein